MSRAQTAAGICIKVPLLSHTLTEREDVVEEEHVRSELNRLEVCEEEGVALDDAVLPHAC